MPQVMAYTQAQQLRVVSLSTLSPSLEDVFLEITGQKVGTIKNSGDKMPGPRGRRRKRR